MDTHAEGWKGLNQLYTRIANRAWQDALDVYGAAWRRGLTTPEMDKLVNASSVGERYANAYWIKGHAFRQIRSRLREVRKADPGQTAALDDLERDLVRLYYLGRFGDYLGRFGDYVGRIADVPGR